MGYKLKLNNKIFNATDADNRKITIPLQDDFDVIFFAKWQNRSNNGAYKKDYVEDVEFTKIVSKGILKHCFPVINENETSVEIYFDLIIKM